MCVCVCVSVCVRACVRASVCACVRSCVRACMRELSPSVQSTGVPYFGKCVIYLCVLFC